MSKNQVDSFVRSGSKYLVSTYFVLGIILGDRAEQKQRVPVIVELTLWGGDPH